MFHATRKRGLVLTAVTLLAVVIYLSFDTYIQPSISRIVPLASYKGAIHLPTSTIVPHKSDPTVPKKPKKPNSPASPGKPSPPELDTTAHDSTASILLVSALFPLSKSKHSAREYNAWLLRFLGQITTEIYFFTPPDMEATVRLARGSLPITINTTFSSPFDVPPLQDLRGKYEKMQELDRESGIHSAELYAIWNAKPYLLDEAVKNSVSLGNKSWDYAFWSDAGSFRSTHTYIKWPDAKRIEEVFAKGSKMSGTKHQDMIFFPIWELPNPSMEFWTEKMGPVDNEFSEGSFFGGPLAAISWWCRTFYTYHNAYLSQNLFVGKDQTLINALLLLFPERFVTVYLNDRQASAKYNFELLPDESPLGSCGTPWFYYQWWMANAEERVKMTRIWNGGWIWAFWGWWRPRNTCRMTGALSIDSGLKRQFGPSWRPPTRDLVI